MFRRILLGVLALGVACIMLASNALAEDVFVTKYGKKYHKEDSRFIKGKEVIKLDREEAEAQGYEPSSDFLEKEESTEEKNAE